MNRQLEEVRLSPEDYLEGEERGEIRHEYVAGSVYAMSGASEAHNLIAGNFFTALKLRLRGGPCRVFISDMKTRIEPRSRNGGQDCFYYPDIQVTCSTTDSDRYFKREPKLIVEVLSDSTERRDRAEKFRDYRCLEILEEYVLVAEDMRRVELYRRSTGWALELFTDSGELQLDSVQLTLSLDSVYEDVGVPICR